MGNIKVLSRRTMVHGDPGISFGMAAFISVDGELTVRDEGHIIYLHGQWVGYGGEEILYTATTESVYDLHARAYLSVNEGNEYEEEIQRLEQEGISEWFPNCDFRERYKEQLEELAELIFDVRDNIDSDL